MLIRPIVNNLFSIDLNDANIIKIYSPQNYEIIQSIFNEIFIDKTINHDDSELLLQVIF